MARKKVVSIIIVCAMIIASLPGFVLAAEDTNYLSLENNADRYVEGSSAFSVKVIKYNESGTKTEVTGAKLTSSNPAVFAVEGDQLVPKKTGYSLITAEYDGMTAGMTMVCIPEDMPTKTEAGIAEGFQVPAGGLAGHDGGQAYMQPSPVPTDWYLLRVLVNRDQQWFT
ncbi:MAG: hypothetical protein SO147_06025, partial [Clostridia bacterium]|nr:hypothetical protein [Clostridia bacterium]